LLTHCLSFWLLQLATRKSPARSRFRNQFILRRRNHTRCDLLHRSPRRPVVHLQAWASNPTQPRSSPTSGSTTPWSSLAWAPLYSRSFTWSWF